MSDIVIYAGRLQEIVEQIFLCVGVESEASATTASALVEAECQGLASHGVLVLPQVSEREKNRLFYRNGFGDSHPDPGGVS